jgi:hypothetical protein
MGMHSQRDIIVGWLDGKKLAQIINGGDLTWHLVLRMFRVIVYSMRHCVGREVLRTILYNRRKQYKESTGPSYIQKRETELRVKSSYHVSTCSNTERLLVSKSRAYKRLLRDISEVSRGRGVVSLSGLNRGSINRADVDPVDTCSDIDDARYGIDCETYIRLKKMIDRLVGAELTHSTSQLGGLFCDTLFDLIKEMNKFDVCLTNTEIYAIRMVSTASKVKIEQDSFASWFAKGLGVNNTRKWLQLEHARHSSSVQSSAQSLNVAQMVYNVYVSCVMGDDVQQVDEVDYPELLLLDIGFIHLARGKFYGQVTQATVLVIVGQRLTDAGVSVDIIHKCLGRLAVSPAFLEVGKAETCRGDTRVIDALKNAVVCATDGLSGRNNTQFHERMLQEVTRETSHRGYPSSRIASSIARKWTMATRKACTTSPGGRTAVYSAFTSPEDTRAAFSSDLLLPKAARYISRDFHFNTRDIMKRSGFNLAVHSKRYSELAHML